MAERTASGAEAVLLIKCVCDVIRDFSTRPTALVEMTVILEIQYIPKCGDSDSIEKACRRQASEE